MTQSRDLFHFLKIRLSRAGYWIVLALLAVLHLVATQVFGWRPSGFPFAVVLWVVALRLHDLGASGWWSLLLLLPIFGVAALHGAVLVQFALICTAFLGLVILGSWPGRSAHDKPEPFAR